MRKTNLMPSRFPRLLTTPSSTQKSDEHRRQRELDRICGVNQPKSVSIPLSTIVPLLIEASENDRAWLNDFADDTVEVNSDLYEILMACQSMQDNKAA